MYKGLVSIFNRWYMLHILHVRLCYMYEPCHIFLYFLSDISLIRFFRISSGFKNSLALKTGSVIPGQTNITKLITTSISIKQSVHESLQCMNKICFLMVITNQLVTVVYFVVKCMTL